MLGQVGPMLSHLGPISWAYVGPSRAHVEPHRAHFGAILAQVGPMSGYVGLILGHVGPMLGPCWLMLGLCTYHRHGHTGIARKVADGCGRLGNVERRYPASWTLWDSPGYLDFPLPRAFFPWRCTGRCPTWLASSWEQPSPS